MRPLRFLSCAAAVMLLSVSSSAWAQDEGEEGAPPAESPPPTQVEVQVIPEPPPAEAEVAPAPSDPPPANLVPQAAPVDGTHDATAVQGERNPAILDGHVRSGPFLSGPGSLTFVLHHTLMGAAGGLVTQGISTRFSLDAGSRERMLIGTLLGAGLGFGASAWWQFNHWIGAPSASYGIVNSVATGMFLFGLIDLFVDNSEALAWTGFIGMELGAWLTATVGGGDLPVNHGLLISSGAMWGLIYSGLMMATLGSSGVKMEAGPIIDTMFISTGLGAGLLALATAKYDPTALQILRADAFGLGVGGALFVLSSLVTGFRFDRATPYVTAMVGSAAAIAVVSLLWEEAAEGPADKAVGQGAGAAYFYRTKDSARPYRNVWW